MGRPRPNHRIRWDHFEDPPGVRHGAFALLVLHGACALVLVALVYAARVIEDTTAVMFGVYGGATQLIYVVPLLLVRRGPSWRRFRIGVVLVAALTIVVSALLVLALMSIARHYRG